MATGLNLSNRIWAKNLFLKHENTFWGFYQEVFLSGQIEIVHAPKNKPIKDLENPHTHLTENLDPSVPRGLSSVFCLSS